jgi:peptide/nickel transport system permease protein
MPEQPRSETEDIVRSLATDERRRDVPPDEASLYIAAAEAGAAPHEGAARERFGIGAWLAFIWLGVLILAALLAPWLPIPDPKNDKAAPILFSHGPTLAHPFGLDGLGRDVLSETIWAARNSLFIGFVSILIGFLIGGMFGLLSGYFRGRLGSVLGGTTDVLLAFPPLVLALTIVAVFGQGLLQVTIALAIVSIPILARITRASTLTWSDREFVLAARAQGGKHPRLMFREILPNVLPAMFSIALLGIAVVIVSEGGLAILGAGVGSGTLTWGTMIATGQSDLRTAPHIVLFPCLMIFLTVLALNYVGDVVRKRFDVRESGL